MTFSILSVCTGNVCRSPVAEAAIRQALSETFPVLVHSAGTGALVGSGTPDLTVKLAAQHGLDVEDHRGRQINGGLIQTSDLILGMAREHRRHVVELFPGAMRRAFTLRELGRIAEAVESRLPDAVRAAGASSAEDGMRAAIALAASLRGTVVPPSEPTDLDVIDPYRQPEDVYQRSFLQLMPAARRVSDYLASAATIATA